MNKIRQTLATNLEMLMKAKGWDTPKLSLKAGLASSSINYYRNAQHACSVDKLQLMAQALKMPAWAMLLPGLTSDVSKKELELLLQCFTASTVGGRSAVARFALSQAMLADPAGPFARLALSEPPLK